MSKIRTYIDSDVLIHAFRADDPNKSGRALDVIADIKRQIITSDYLKLELLPKAIFVKRISEAEYYNTVFASSEIIPSSDQIVSKALEIGCQCGLGAMDALHVASAIYGNADELITFERETKPYFRAAVHLKITSLSS
jgi:predicted nucleic acid-binding protein